jgi:hypothetical protein
VLVSGLARVKVSEWVSGRSVEKTALPYILQAFYLFRE